MIILLISNWKGSWIMVQKSMENMVVLQRMMEKMTWGLRGYHCLYKKPNLIKVNVLWVLKDNTSIHRSDLCLQGTQPFMASELLHNEFRKPEARFDLESFFYMFMYMAVTYTGPGNRQLAYKDMPIFFPPKCNVNSRIAQRWECWLQFHSRIVCD